ncbi:hypothetical protein Bbelb_282800 [Branchiostoma belcheri]|nr:hypothetical protein Bbelb_282800 [Branchiostoma belcheri]
MKKLNPFKKWQEEKEKEEKKHQKKQYGSPHHFVRSQLCVRDAVKGCLSGGSNSERVHSELVWVQVEACYAFTNDLGEEVYRAFELSELVPVHSDSYFRCQQHLLELVTGMELKLGLHEGSRISTTGFFRTSCISSARLRLMEDGRLILHVLNILHFFHSRGRLILHVLNILHFFYSRGASFSTRGRLILHVLNILHFFHSRGRLILHVLNILHFFYSRGRLILHVLNILHFFYSRGRLILQVLNILHFFYSRGASFFKS